MFEQNFTARKNKFVADFKANRKKYLSIGVAVIFIVLTLIYLGPFNGLEKLGLIGKKKEGQEAKAAAVRGLAGDGWADVVIGQKDFTEVNPYATGADKLWNPHGVIVDRSVNPQRIYIYDSGNNRILGLNLENCLSSATCVADLIIGQTSSDKSACNGDSAFQNFPLRASASRTSLCGEYEGEISIAEGGSGSSMFVDGSGNLYTADFFNHRVLKYNSPFTTDTSADDVWGQDDFSKNDCNKGGAANATTLCFSKGESNNWTGSVDVDSSGNVWIADNGNNRVLRFPPGSKTADLVLGQTGFTSNNRGSGLNQFSDPCCVRVNSQGWVYVADHKNGRVVRFKGPFTNGMDGEVFASGLAGPSSVDFDPTEPGAIWVSNEFNKTLELWDETTRTKRKTLGVAGNGNILNAASGSVGVDSQGNVYVANKRGDYSDDVIMFQKGGSTTTPAKRLFTNNVPKNLDGQELGQGVSGVAVANNQLVVSENGRILFWNNPDPANLTNGKPADGYLAGFSNININGFGITDGSCCLALKADNAGHLWVYGNNSHGYPYRVLVYDFPLTSGETPSKVIQGSIPTLDGGSINLNWIGWGIAPSSDGSHLWLSQKDSNRVIRVRDPLGANPKVDAILGQTSNSAIVCSTTSTTGLCHPGAVSFDRQGNLFVSDSSLELAGSRRLMVFRSQDLPTGNSTMIYAPAAFKVFPGISTWEPSFDANNRMIVGFNPFNDANPEKGWFPAIYNDPLDPNSLTPNFYLNDYFSQAFATAVDAGGNIFVADLNRARVLVYKGPITPSPVGTSCDTSFPRDKFHGCWFDGVNPATGAFLGQRDERTFTSPAAALTAGIFHGYLNNSPDWGKYDNFSAVWRGDIDFAAGDYIFKTETDDGVRVDIGNDGTYEINVFVIQPPIQTTSPITLNGYTPIKVEWFEGGAKALIKFTWERVGGSLLETSPTPFPTLAPSPLPTPSSPSPTPVSSPSPSPVGDTLAPVVAITSPSNGATVSKFVEINANANDNIGVVKMEILIDGNVVTSSNLSTIYHRWNTNPKGVSRGPHTIQAKAYDASGNVGSLSITVTKP